MRSHPERCRHPERSEGSLIRWFALLTMTIASCVTPGENSKQHGKQFYFEAEHPSKPDKKIYLYGSIHIGGPLVGEPSKKVVEQFEKSKVLAVEIDPSTLKPEDFELKREKIVAREVMSKRFKEILKEKFGEKSTDYLLSEDVCEVGPALVMGILRKDKSFDFQNGIDNQFMRLAKAKHIPIKSLETIQENMNAYQYLKFPKDEVTQICVASVKEIEDEPDFQKLLVEELKGLAEDWQNGDEVAIREKFTDELRNVPENLRAKVLKEINETRNRNMADRIDKLFEAEKSGSVFVVIGSAHFVENNNVLEFLKKSGFAVRRLDPR